MEVTSSITQPSLEDTRTIQCTLETGNESFAKNRDLIVLNCKCTKEPYWVQDLELHQANLASKVNLCLIIHTDIRIFFKCVLHGYIIKDFRTECLKKLFSKWKNGYAKW